MPQFANLTPTTTKTKRGNVPYLDFWSFMIKSITKLLSHELVKSYFVLPVTLSGAKKA